MLQCKQVLHHLKKKKTKKQNFGPNVKRKRSLEPFKEIMKVTNQKFVKRLRTKERPLHFFQLLTPKKKKKKKERSSCFRIFFFLFFLHYLFLSTIVHFNSGLSCTFHHNTSLSKIGHKISISGNDKCIFPIPFGMQFVNI